MAAVSGLVAVLFLITGAASQGEVECLTSCGSSGAILSVEESIVACCVGLSGGAFNIPGAGRAIDCAPCSDYKNIAGEIGFSFSPESLRVNESLTAECVVSTQAGLSNPRADITWLGPDRSVFSSQQNVGFKAVGNGISQQEARLPLNFPQFSASNFGEYSCIASITSESLSGARTNVFRSVQIPTIADVSRVPVPIYPIGEPSIPVAGQRYTIDCIVNTPGLTNNDVQWVGPDNIIISATSGRVSVGDVVEDGNGRSVHTLTFNPLSTDDSGPYTCTSPNGPGVQTLTVDVPMADTMLSNVPPVPVGGQALQIDCSSAVPQDLQGQVTVILFGPDGSMLANTTGATRANAVFSIQRATPANSGMYECRVTITSPFLMSGGTSRALQDTATLTVDVPPVDECRIGEDNCDQNAICMDLPERFVCLCQMGFNGSGIAGDCQDINECLMRVCAEDEVCRNTMGGFSCDPPPTQPPTDTASPDTPSDTPSTAPPVTSPSVVPSVEPTVGIQPSNGPAPPLPVLPSGCDTPCHTNGECVEIAAGMFECRCKDGFQGNGALCCINNVLIDLLQKQAARKDKGKEDQEEEEKEEEDSSSKKSKKKKKKGKKRGRRSKGKGRSHRRSSKRCTKRTKSKKSCVEEPKDGPQDPAFLGYDINLVSVPEQCRDILNALVMKRP